MVVAEVPDGFNVLARMQNHQYGCNHWPWATFIARAVISPTLFYFVCGTFANIVISLNESASIWQNIAKVRFVSISRLDKNS